MYRYTVRTDSGEITSMDVTVLRAWILENVKPWDFAILGLITEPDEVIADGTFDRIAATLEGVTVEREPVPEIHLAV